MTATKKIALVTPVKNELDNLPRLIDSIEMQAHPICIWIIVDDASTDGSTDFLKKKVNSIKNVDTVLLFHPDDLGQEYKLGAKYSSVIAYGFNKLRDHVTKKCLTVDYIGILDSDCFVDTHYYQRLIEKFELLPKLGIASGVIYYKGMNGLRYDKLPLRWARGGIRVWRSECLTKAGYQIGKTADALSSARAWTSGWHSQAFRDSKAESREMGVKVDPSYYGEAAFSIYMPFYYLLLKCCLLFVKDGFASAKQYFLGYMRAKKEKKRADVSPKVMAYFRFLFWRILIENVIIICNNFILSRHHTVDSETLKALNK